VSVAIDWGSLPTPPPDPVLKEPRPANLAAVKLKLTFHAEPYGGSIAQVSEKNKDTPYIPRVIASKLSEQL
jgi:hypothetical protein